MFPDVMLQEQMSVARSCSFRRFHLSSYASVLLLLVAWGQIIASLAQPSSSECVGADEFLVVNELANFDTAIDRCVALGGVVGVTFNQAELNKVLELGSSFGFNIYLGIGNKLDYQATRHFLGLRDLDNEGGTDPARFELSDTSNDDRSFFDTRGQDAWQAGQPDDRANENCVE